MSRTYIRRHRRRFRLLRGGPTAAALYGDLVRRSFSGAAARVALSADTTEVDVRVASSRQRFAPAFSVHEVGLEDPLAVFDLHRVEPDELRLYIEGDAEWLPCASEPASYFLTRPLRVDDAIEWKTPGSASRGQIFRIRHVATGRDVQEIDGWDPAGFVVYVHPETNGVVEVFRDRDLELNAWNVRIQ